MNPTFTYRDRFEIRFPSIPPVRIRTALKERGFTWDPRAACWHLSRPCGVRFENGRTAAQAAEFKKRHQFRSQQRAEQAMEEACGIA